MRVTVVGLSDCEEPVELIELPRNESETITATTIMIVTCFFECISPPHSKRN